MAIEVKAKISIDRHRQEVAKVMFNPKLDKLWIRELREVYPMKAGLYQKGSKVERVGIFLNTHYSSKLLVTKMVENEIVELYGDEPFEMKIRYRLSESETGTVAEVTIMSFGEIRFNKPVTAISKNLQENIEGDLRRLKRHVESLDQ